MYSVAIPVDRPGVRIEAQFPARRCDRSEWFHFFKIITSTDGVGEKRTQLKPPVQADRSLDVEITKIYNDTMKALVADSEEVYAQAQKKLNVVFRKYKAMAAEDDSVVILGPFLEAISGERRSELMALLKRAKELVATIDRKDPILTSPPKELPQGGQLNQLNDTTPLLDETIINSGVNSTTHSSEDTDARVQRAHREGLIALLEYTQEINQFQITHPRFCGAGSIHSGLIIAAGAFITDLATMFLTLDIPRCIDSYHRSHQKVIFSLTLTTAVLSLIRACMTLTERGSLSIAGVSEENWQFLTKEGDLDESARQELEERLKKSEAWRKLQSLTLGFKFAKCVRENMLFLARDAMFDLCLIEKQIEGKRLLPEALLDQKKKLGQVVKAHLRSAQVVSLSSCIGALILLLSSSGHVFLAAKFIPDSMACPANASYTLPPHDERNDLSNAFIPALIVTAIGCVFVSYRAFAWHFRKPRI